MFTISTTIGIVSGRSMADSEAAVYDHMIASRRTKHPVINAEAKWHRGSSHSGRRLKAVATSTLRTAVPGDRRHGSTPRPSRHDPTAMGNDQGDAIAVESKYIFSARCDSGTGSLRKIFGSWGADPPGSGQLHWVTPWLEPRREGCARRRWGAPAVTIKGCFTHEKPRRHKKNRNIGGYN